MVSGYVKKNLKKNLKKIDMISARVELAPLSPITCIVTILPYYPRSTLSFFTARTTHRTRMRSITAEESDVVMTDDGPQRPIKQVDKALHHAPATRAWCGPLLLVLGGVVSLFVLFACCLMSSNRFLGCSSGKKHKTSEIWEHLRYSYLIRTVLTFPSRVCVDLSHSSSKDR